MKNDKIILWKINVRKKNAYKDQYGVPHEANVVEEEIVATIVEDKILPIGGSKYSTTIATKAKSEDGRFFILTNDGYYWNETDSEFKKVKAQFKNAIKEFNTMEREKSNLPEDSYMRPVIRENGDLAIPQDVEMCTCSLAESHHGLKSHYYYKPNGHCDCFFLKEL